ncbi:hypothetical protein BJV82DRAFT_592617 [Fennellomyces sp. T-0311]|nr:hypothetical protein BJV82DRAFT_592617 [Fennellomyces sp. T-0311]
MHSVPDPAKKRRGEEWAREQSYKISRSATEKLHQLESIVDEHLAWLDQHNTVRKLIETRRPLGQKVDQTKRQQQKHEQSKHEQPKRASTNSDASMHTAPDEMDDQVQLVRSSRHSINAGEGTSLMRSSRSRSDRHSKYGNDQDSSDYMDPDLIPSETPSWATSPELRLKLRTQNPSDGDKIFGPIGPLELSSKAV